MRLASAAFVLLLLGAHAAGDFDQLLGQPLSVFRDGEQGWLGYLLFATLLSVSVLYVGGLIRAGKENEAVTAGLAAGLLFLVAVTPSVQGFHLLCSLLLLLLLFGHYWRLLRASGSPWFILHAVAPFLLVLATGCHSYGLWQKCLILYVVVLVNVRHYMLSKGAANPRGIRKDGTRRRQKTYCMEAGREWTRSRATRAAAMDSPCE